eukprot:1160449-Pelagomonas_calceolata.AAC.4
MRSPCPAKNQGNQVCKIDQICPDNGPAYSDYHLQPFMTAHDRNLRQYCTLIGANLEIVTEALSFVNVSYLLPLCINGPPYDHGTEEGAPPAARTNTWLL